MVYGFSVLECALNLLQVPAIIAALTANSFLFEIYDVSSVNSVVTGSAPFGPRMAESLKAVQPGWQVLPGYGMFPHNTYYCSAQALTYGRAD